jgi:RNA polymerase sigma-70 factor (ECF subfamily)
MSSSADFDALLARARSGDPSATSELARKYERSVRLVARVNLGPALRPYLDSMDLVQSVHKSVLLGLRGDKLDISTPEKLLALALTMVRRKLARHWRHLQRQQRLQTPVPAGQDVPDLLTALSSHHDDPALRAQFRDAVAHVCRQLDPFDQQVLQLRLQGHSTAEVARLVGVQANILRVRLSRLRERLRGAGVLTEWI